MPAMAVQYSTSATPLSRSRRPGPGGGGAITASAPSECTRSSPATTAAPSNDHPWAFLAIGLSGSYIEETPDPGLVEHDELGAVTHCPLPGIWWNRKRRFTAPFVNVKRATDLHVLDVHDGPVWTLFLTRPKTRSWGFAGPFGWMGWRDFDSAFPERDAWTDA